MISFENWQATKTIASIKDNELRFWLVSNKNYQGLDLRETTNLTLRKKKSKYGIWWMFLYNDSDIVLIFPWFFKLYLGDFVTPLISFYPRIKKKRARIQYDDYVDSSIEIWMVVSSDVSTVDELRKHGTPWHRDIIYLDSNVYSLWILCKFWISSDKFINTINSN